MTDYQRRKRNLTNCWSYTEKDFSQFDWTRKKEIEKEQKRLDDKFKELLGNFTEEDILNPIGVK